MSTNTRRHTFCRICEPHCPLQAEADAQGQIVALHPDPGHPAGGTPCHKGLSFLKVHRDPDRLNQPMRRTNPRIEARGQFAETTWDQALSDIGARIRSLCDQHGPDSVAVYFGNPSVFNAGGLMMTSVFLETLGTRMRFSAATLDASNKFAGAGAIYGSSAAFMAPDIYNTHYLLVLGSNPRVSHWTLVSAPNDIDVIKQIQRRGGKVRFVNPRRIESSTAETGPTLRIRPGTDVYFLAALLYEIDRLQGFDEALIARYGKNLAGLRVFIQRYPPERVATLTGIERMAIEEIARELMAAPSAAVYIATGVNQSRQGLLCFWLSEMINFVTGNLGRKGGTHKPDGLLNHYPPVGGTQLIQTSMGPIEISDPIGYVTLPATLLPDLIEKGDIRALIVIAGNPLLSAGGEERLRNAFEKLELMVSLDIYRSATAEMCDYALPSTDWLERPDINFMCDGMQAIPHLQYTDAMAPPMAGRRHDWWTLARLLQTIGLPSPLDAQPAASDGSDMLQGLMATRSLTIEAMRAAPHSTVVFPELPRDILFERCLQHADHKIDCCPAAFEQARLFDRCESIFEEMSSEPAGSLRLISLRTTHMHNSWLANSEVLRHGRQQINPLNICEADAARHGLHDGDPVRVSNAHGTIETRVLINNDLRPGAVAMSHGYGHRHAYGLQVASARPGANFNALMPVGPGVAEPLSSMSWLSAVPVFVERILPVSP